MSKVVTGASVSLDGHIAGPNESGFEHLFAWYGTGDIEYPSTHPELEFRLTSPDHGYLKEYVDTVGVLVVGRWLFNSLTAEATSIRETAGRSRTLSISIR